MTCRFLVPTAPSIWRKWSTVMRSTRDDESAPSRIWKGSGISRETSMALLFSPVEIGPLVAPNRIAISPMCQYSAVDGLPTEWHLQNAMTLAMSGAGVVMLEATAVEPRGRITHGCLGLWSDAHQAAVARIVAEMRTVAPKG